MTNLLPYVQLETAPNPTHAVIWLHGLGSDGHDFAGIVPELRLNDDPAIRFILPHAPKIPVTINNGYVMPAWYDIKNSDIGSHPDEDGITRTTTAIKSLINEQIGFGIPSEKIVLAGFSQGCAMALHIGLTHDQTLGGIVALSGYIPMHENLIKDLNQANRRLPIFLAHGIQDPVVSLERGESARDTLEKLGYQVQWKTYEMPHSVHPQEITDISYFLKSIFAKNNPPN